LQGVNPISGEYWVQTSTGNKFRSYSCYDEAVIDHSVLFTRKANTYPTVVSSYSSGWDKQLMEVAYSRYNASSDKAGYYNRMKAIAKTGQAESFAVFEDTNIAVKYIEKNSLGSKYRNALGLAQGNQCYSQYMKKNDATVSVSAITQGHWECDCVVPCPYCHCHDNDVKDDNGQTVSNSGGTGDNHGNGLYFWPAAGDGGQFRITSLTGSRNASGGSSNHAGIDIGLSMNSNVYSIADGTVIAVKNSYKPGGRGKYIAIKHGNGVYSLYQHLGSQSIAEGDTVKKGQLIGTSGNSGVNRTGVMYAVHLHVEVAHNGGGTDASSFERLFMAKDGTLRIYEDPITCAYENLKIEQLDFSGSSTLLEKAKQRYGNKVKN